MLGGSFVAVRRGFGAGFGGGTALMFSSSGMYAPTARRRRARTLSRQRRDWNAGKPRSSVRRAYGATWPGGGGLVLAITTQTYQKKTKTTTYRTTACVHSVRPPSLEEAALRAWPGRRGAGVSCVKPSSAFWRSTRFATRPQQPQQPTPMITDSSTTHLGQRYDCVAVAAISSHARRLIHTHGARHSDHM